MGYNRQKMKIKSNHKGRERHYVLTLDRKEAEILSYSNEALLSPPTDKGVTFWLYGHPSVFEESFHKMPSDTDPKGYGIYIGDPKVRSTDDLIELIRKRGKIPIEIPGIEGKLNVGYVSFEFVDKFED